MNLMISSQQQIINIGLFSLLVSIIGHSFTSSDLCLSKFDDVLMGPTVWKVTMVNLSLETTNILRLYLHWMCVFCKSYYQNQATCNLYRQYSFLGETVYISSPVCCADSLLKTAPCHLLGWMLG